MLDSLLDCNKQLNMFVADEGHKQSTTLFESKSARQLKV